MKDTAGNEIIPPFLYPCPNRCNSSGGCDSCRTYIKMTPPPITVYPENELSKEEEERFYKKVLTNH